MKNMTALAKLNARTKQIEAIQMVHPQMTLAEAKAIPTTVRYELRLTIDRPLRAEEWDTFGFTVAQCLADFTDRKAKSELEREVIQALRKLDGDCDCEVMDAELLTQEQE